MIWKYLKIEIRAKRASFIEVQQILALRITLKTRQNAENKQTFDFVFDSTPWNIEFEGKNLVKPLKINKLLIWRERLKLREKSRQITESKQTLDFWEKMKLREKSRQNAWNKQTLDLIGKINIE